MSRPAPINLTRAVSMMAGSDVSSPIDCPPSSRVRQHSSSSMSAYSSADSFAQPSSLFMFQHASVSSDIQPTNFANVEDMLFEVFRCEETDTINNIAIAQFLKALESTGLRPASDPRLKEMVQNIQKYQNKIETTQDVKELVIGRKEFKE